MPNHDFKLSSQLWYVNLLSFFFMKSVFTFFSLQLKGWTSWSIFKKGSLFISDFIFLLIFRPHVFWKSSWIHVFLMAFSFHDSIILASSIQSSLTSGLHELYSSWASVFMSFSLHELLSSWVSVFMSFSLHELQYSWISSVFKFSVFWVFSFQCLQVSESSVFWVFGSSVRS